MDYDKKIADLERKIENQQKEMEIFRKAFAELGVMLREEKRHPICGMVSEPSREGEDTKDNDKKDADCYQKDGGLCKSDGIFIPVGFILAYAAGTWTIILIQIFIRLLGGICGIG